MKHTFFLAASGPGVGLTSVSLGVVRALDRRGIRVCFCKPITQSHLADGEMDPSARFIQTTMGKTPPESIPIQQADESVRLANARYNAGTGTQLDVLSAQVDLTTARTNQIQAYYTYNVAVASLRKATGQADEFITK